MDAKTRPLAWGLILAALLSVARPAREQDLSEYIPQGVPGYDTVANPVLARPRPLYDPIGIRLGSFVLHPRLDLGLGYDSNLFGSTPPRGSALFGTHASLLAGSDWSQNSVGAYFGVDDLRSPGVPNQSRTDWTGSAGGTFDLGTDRLTLAAAHLSLHQDRTAIDALPTDGPVPYQVNDFRATYLHAFNRLALTPNLELSTYRFGSATIMGTPAPQSDRNRNLFQAGIAASYALAGSSNLVVVLRGLDTIYTAPQPGAPSRNSTGFVALTGFERDDPVWRWRILFGWEQRNFAAPQFRSHGAPVAQADIAFSPSGLTTITGTLARTIEDAAQEGVAGYTYTTARLTIDHEYMRNVLLQGFASVQHAAFLQGGGVQTSFTLGGSVTWLINRRLRLTATEAFTDLISVQGQSAPTGGSYVRNVTVLTLGFGL
jgi:hypothetical protein